MTGGRSGRYINGYKYSLRLIMAILCWTMVLPFLPVFASTPEPASVMEGSERVVADAGQSASDKTAADTASLDAANNHIDEGTQTEEDLTLSDNGDILVEGESGEEETEEEDAGIKLFLDGDEIFLTDPIQNLQGRTYLPLRSLCEILGAEVTWQQELNSVSVARDRVEAIFGVDNGFYTVNGLVRHMTDASMYLDTAINRVYVPIRYEAETFGYRVEWVDEDGFQTIQIYSTPISEGELTDNEITIGGKYVWLGQSERQLIASLGYPNRIDESAYGLQWFVYNRNYREFIMVGMRNQRVCGFFSNSQHLNVKADVGYGAYKNEVEAVGFNRDTMDFWFDPHDSDRLFAVFCMMEKPSMAEQQALFDQSAELLLRAYEMECFDITNAFRTASGKPEVLYNVYAARVALAYAKDMADRNFLDHISPEGNNPLDRFESQGIYVLQVSENLAGGFSDAMHAIRGWVESESHRSGMLEENQYLGVGAYYKQASRYRYYYVQEFITFD
ncbi:MAG: CAP domain-containing protein [Peptococcaceae bacterium]|jgi:hypothetical protein|nr:CAP domain-containing protein [Peptococcaceae bacterium]